MNCWKSLSLDVWRLMLSFGAFLQQLNWSKAKALLKYHTHIAFYSALRKPFSSILLPCRHFLQWGTCRQTPFINLLPGDPPTTMGSSMCSFPNTSIVAHTVSLERCCPLLFTLDLNDLLLSKDCRTSRATVLVTASSWLEERVHVFPVLVSVF